MPLYICVSCESTEEMPASKFKKGMHCECGGHLHLRLFDNYDEHSNKCYKCKNYASIECIPCKWSKANL